MKKLLLLFVCLFTIQSVVRANDDKPIKVDQLPLATARLLWLKWKPIGLIRVMMSFLLMAIK